MRQELLSPNVKLYDFIDEVDHTANDADTEDYRSESARLDSFKNWPVTYINPEQLATAGFYYTGHRDLVKCFDCRVKVGEWVTGDDPVFEHRKFSPTCDHAKQISFTGLPIIQNYGVVVHQPSESGRDVCGIYKDEYLNFTSNVENAKHRRYSSYGERLGSFRFWDTSRTQTKERLAEAGFFYTGTRDQTLCFYCGVGLCDWQPYEDPWEMHCFWMPNCHYLLTIKGQDYPQRVRQTWSQRHQTSQPERQELPSAALPAIEPRNESVPEELRHPQTNTGNILENIIAALSNQNCEEDGGACTSTPESLTTDAEHLLCRICYNEMRDILFLPCNHIVTCGTCANRIERCPVCRMKITCTFRVRYD